MKISPILIGAAAIAVALPLSAYERREGVLEGSRFYPGTTHRYTVTVPEGYDASRGAALYVGLDGILCDAPRRLDSLAAAGDIPPMIGVFVEAGVVRNDSGEVVRYNRSNEFDAPDGRFARFLETELLPQALDGLTVLPEPENAMIFGLSSGGIAAFNAAWQRPDLFGRVYGGCGTFVPMRGADGLQALVRKAEPRPIKVFLQDGFSDTWNPLFGSWYEANRLMASALEFAGYDCAFDWAEGGHRVRRASLIFPEVMKWLWADSSAKPTGNATLAPILADSGEWQEAEACAFEPQPSATYPCGSHVVRPAGGSNYLWQYLVDSNGNEYAGQPFYYLHSLENRAMRLGGMSFDGDGNLWVVTEAGIQVCDQNGRVRAIVRLPGELEKALVDDRTANPLAASALTLTDSGLTLHTPSATYTRALNAVPPGSTRPESQGQG